MGKVARIIARNIGSLCLTSLWFVGLGIHFYCLYLARLSGFVAMALTFVLPFVSQFYWLWTSWRTTGIFFNPLTIACLVWLGLCAVGSILYIASEE